MRGLDANVTRGLLVVSHVVALPIQKTEVIVTAMVVVSNSLNSNLDISSPSEDTCLSL